MHHCVDEEQTREGRWRGQQPAEYLGGPGVLLTYGKREIAHTNDANRHGTLLVPVFITSNIKTTD